MLMTMNTVACYRLHARKRLQRYKQYVEHCSPSKLTSEDRKYHDMTSKPRSGPLFGVRRPLRHLTEVLDLDEEQVRSVAGILDEMKLAYAQALLSRERARSAIATVFSAENLTPADLQNALSGRETATATLNAELAQLLAQLFTVLDAEQRKGFAHMLRKGSFLL